MARKIGWKIKLFGNSLLKNTKQYITNRDKNSLYSEGTADNLESSLLFWSYYNNKMYVQMLDKCAEYGAQMFIFYLD